MKINFEKYQGTGNDFILIDDRSNAFPERDLSLITHLCDRKFGIGSDGLMLIRNHHECDFEMVFFNPDGSRSLCGNGSRCAVHFAGKIGVRSGTKTFLTTDGLHAYNLHSDGDISVQMRDVSTWKKWNENMFIHTGSPHLIIFEKHLSTLDVVQRGREIRYHSDFADGGGTNVNFIEEKSPGSFAIRTYERGVENETLSCGTGVTAAALALALAGKADKEVELLTLGGRLKVQFRFSDNKFSEIWLKGPAKFIFSGRIDA